MTHAARWRFLSLIVGALALGAMLALNVLFMVYELTRLASRTTEEEAALVEVEDGRAGLPPIIRSYLDATPSLIVSWGLVIAIATVRMLAGLVVVPTAHKLCGKFRFRDQVRSFFFLFFFFLRSFFFLFFFFLLLRPSGLTTEARPSSKCVRCLSPSCRSRPVARCSRLSCLRCFSDASPPASPARPPRRTDARAVCVVYRLSTH